MHKPFLILIGMASVGLAFIGIFLPLLPTVPFLLLALACFARSSEKLHQWILSHKRFGPHIRMWHETRSMTIRTKIYAIISIIGFGSISIINADRIWLQFLIFFILAIPVTIILKARNAVVQT
ncbi:MAG: YbaN family protein [Deltaproteobacteria bacterium]|nr:YbaN family protein [Deltaproteobacteria bacterium]